MKHFLKLPESTISWDCATLKRATLKGTMHAVANGGFAAAFSDQYHLLRQQHLRCRLWCVPSSKFNASYQIRQRSVAFGLRLS